MAEEVKWEEAEAFLKKLEKRVELLETRRGAGAATPAEQAIPETAEALVEENKQLKKKVERLEYRIKILSRALREADAKLGLKPSEMI